MASGIPYYTWRLMDWCYLGAMVLGILSVPTAFIIGFLATEWVSLILFEQVAPHDGQNGMAAFFFGLGGGALLASGTLVYLIVRAVRRNAEST